MRFWHIAVIVFAFSMAVSIVNTTFIDSGLYNLGPRFETADQISGNINQTIEELNASAGQISSGNDVLDWLYSASMLINGLTLLVSTLGNATIMLPWLLERFYFPSALAWGISSIVWLVYGLAIIQFFTGRQTKGME